MSEGYGDQENPEEREIDQKELSSVKMVIQTMVKAIKAFRMYLPNNPLLKRFIGELEEKMFDHLDEYGEIRLDIDQFELKYRGTAIYENRNTKDSLAFRIYSDGIRGLIFSEGMEDREVHSFLDIVGGENSDIMDDDIVTQLWERDLPHITYIVAEEAAEYSNDELGGRSETSAHKEGIRGASKEMSEAEPIPTPITVPQSILSLTEEEMAWLKSAREIEEKKKPMEEVLHILSSILAVEKDAALFEELAGIMVNLIRELLHMGEVRYAFGLVKFMDNLSEGKNLPEEHRGILLKLREGIVSREMIDDLGDIIDKTDKIKPGEIKELILLLGNAAIKPLCGLLGLVQKKDMRKAIIDGLVEVGRDSPEDFFPCLTDDRWYLVRNAVFILRSIGSPRAIEPVGKLVHHRDLRIRREVLLYLQSVPDMEAKGHLLKFLNDEDSSLRVYAIKTLASVKYTDALMPILDIARSRDFDEKEMPEKRAVFEAIGEIGSDDMIPMFREMIMKRYLLSKTKEREAVSCAAAGLRKVKSKGALDVLKEASAVKKGDAAEIVNQAVKALTGEITKDKTGDERSDG